MYKDFFMEIARLYPYPGGEEKALQIVREYFDGLGERLEEPLLSYPAYFLPGRGEAASAVVAYLDEPGFLLREYLGNGFVGISCYGAVDKRALTAQEVFLLGKERHFGMIGNKPSHYLTDDDRKATVDVEKLFVDTGLTTEELEESHPIGSFIGLKAEPRMLRGQTVAGHGLSCKVGCAALLIALKALSEAKDRGACYFLIVDRSARGQYELRRALEKYRVKTVLSLAGVPSNSRIDDPEQCRLGGGAVLLYDSCVDFTLTKKLRKSGEEAGLPLQSRFYNFDADSMLETVFTAGTGRSCAGIGIPVENSGMPFELSCLDDLETAGMLAASLLYKEIAYDPI